MRTDDEIVVSRAEPIESVERLSTSASVEQCNSFAVQRLDVVGFDGKDAIAADDDVTERGTLSLQQTCCCQHIKHDRIIIIIVIYILLPVKFEFC